MAHLGCNAAKKNHQKSKLNPTKPKQTIRSDACSHDPKF